MTTTPGHVIEVVPHDHVSCHTARHAEGGDCGTRFEARCSCGWAQGASSLAAAEAIAVGHRDYSPNAAVIITADIPQGPARTAVTRVGRTWKLWAYRYASGKLWHIGERRWVELHQLSDPLVPVLVEEILDDQYAPEVTHYGWQSTEGSRHKHGDVPAMIQIRTGKDPKDLKRALMFLSMCFPYGLDAAIKDGDGTIVALRITELSAAAANAEDVP